LPHRLETIGVDRWDRLFLTIVPEALRVFSNRPDSQHFGGPPSRTTPVVTAFPWLEDLRRLRAKAEIPFMLPGFRFLFAAIVLSTSMLIFGLGAAALLRAAHEEFASIPSRRAPPEPLFAQQGDAGPVLAMLRADSEQPAIAPAPPEPERPATEPDKIAALTDVATPAENSPASEAPAPETPAPEISTQAETPAAADMPSPVAETKVAAIAEMLPAAPHQIAAAAPEQASEPADDSTRIAETRIATLGGPPVIIETKTPSKIAPAVIRKQARRAIQRRRIAQRARIARHRRNPLTRSAARIAAPRFQNRRPGRRKGNGLRLPDLTTDYCSTNEISPTTGFASGAGGLDGTIVTACSAFSSPLASRSAATSVISKLIDRAMSA
jgi:hypothetical protein